MRIEHASRYFALALGAAAALAYAQTATSPVAVLSDRLGALLVFAGSVDSADLLRLVIGEPTALAAAAAGAFGLWLTVRGNGGATVRATVPGDARDQQTPRRRAG